MKKIILPFLFLSIFFTQNTNAQIIESVEGALSSSSDVGGDFEDWWFLIDLLWYPTYGAMIGFEGEPLPNEIDFAQYPYQDEGVGIYKPLFNSGYRVRSEFNLHFQSNEDNLYGGYGQFKFSPARFLNLELNHLRLVEVLDNQKDKTDQLNITNFSVQYNRIRHHKIQGWWGLGVMAIDGEQNYVSPSFVAGGTWYFMKPLSLYADTQVGYPNDTYAVQGQIRIQAHIDRCKIYVGYQGIRFGEVFEPNWSFGGGVYF